jgi:hypothetical protein
VALEVDKLPGQASPARPPASPTPRGSHTDSPLPGTALHMGIRNNELGYGDHKTTNFRNAGKLVTRAKQKRLRSTNPLQLRRPLEIRLHGAKQRYRLGYPVLLRGIRAARRHGRKSGAPESTQNPPPRDTATPDPPRTSRRGTCT